MLVDTEVVIKPEPVTMIGIADHRYQPVPFGIKQTDRRMHSYFVGQTGTGKSTLLYNMAVQDARNGRAFCLIDPHGDLAESLRDAIGDNYIYWNVADPDSPYGYNPLLKVSALQRPLLASGLIEALKKQWDASSWGSRMEHLLRYSVLCLLEQPRADLRDIGRLFVDKHFRRQAVARIEDEQTLYFWKQEFPNMNYKNSADGFAPIANKLGAFLSNPFVRTAICTPKQPLRFRKLMDSGQTLIVNLAKGRLGADTANVLGGLIVSSLANAAFTRHDTPEKARQDYRLYIDEFHNFSTTSLATSLAELRKFRLSMILSHQYLSQLESEVFEAVMGNVGSMVVFRVGVLDTPLLQKQLVSVSKPDLINQPNHRAFIRLMVDGQRTPTFSANLSPPII